MRSVVSFNFMLLAFVFHAFVLFYRVCSVDYTYDVIMCCVDLFYVLLITVIHQKT